MSHFILLGVCFGVLVWLQNENAFYANVITEKHNKNSPLRLRLTACKVRSRYCE